MSAGWTFLDSLSGSQLAQELPQLFTRVQLARRLSDISRVVSDNCLVVLLLPLHTAQCCSAQTCAQEEEEERCREEVVVVAVLILRGAAAAHAVPATAAQQVPACTGSGSTRMHW